METKKVYIVRPFDKVKGIMSPVHVFSSIDAIINWYHGRTITDEFGRISNIDDLKEYINGGQAVIKIVAEELKGGLFDLLNIQSSELEYYHVSVENLID